MRDTSMIDVGPFTPVRIRGLELANRFVMSAAVDGLGGDPQARQRRFAALAEGGIGLIIAGRVLDASEEFGRVADAVHEKGGKIALQLLSHTGLGFGSPDAAAASVVSEHSPIFNAIFPYGPHHEASRGEIQGMVEAFADSARAAKSYGVDAVEAHAAHNSALFQFLTPLINQRRDEWGGPVENRARLLLDVCAAIRAEVGPDIPILVKLGVKDVFPGGLTLAEGVEAAKLLERGECDAIEVSQGLQDVGDMKKMAGTPIRMGIVKTSQEAYYREWCAAVKAAVGKPTILTGGIRSLDTAQDVLARGEADLAAMCRPFVREPDLVSRWRDGDPARARCVSCNKCAFALAEGRPLACDLEDRG